MAAVTDIFIRRPVLATVISLLIFTLGLRALFSLPIMQYPFTENAVVTVTTTFVGADPELIAGFITTPLENSISQANGIDYMTSSSVQNASTITINLQLNYDVNKALADINTKVNAVLNQLPKASQLPVITVSIGQTIDAMYMGFYSDVIPTNQITDYLVRAVQPKLQAVNGVQVAEILGGRQYAIRAWLKPERLAAVNLTAADVANALAVNDFVAGVGRTDGNMLTLNLTTTTNLTNVEQFKQMILKSDANGSTVRLKDVADVELGAQEYDKSVSFNGKTAVYMGIQVTPAANLLTVISDIKRLFPTIQAQLPAGMSANIVYDSTKYVNSSITEVVKSLLEAFLIVAVVIFLFLGSLRSVMIPLVAIPLSLIGAFFIMFVLGYSINLLTLLALVLAIGLVVDDAIIVVENVQRHMEEGQTLRNAALLGARELSGPIIAITVVLIAVYVPIGFMGGLTGALFTEFAFTLAGAVTVSAVIALTLSPMMCSKVLKVAESKPRFVAYIDDLFLRLQHRYEYILNDSLYYLPVTMVFAVIILLSNYFLFVTSQTELAPQEDQGIILAQATANANAALPQTEMYAKQIFQIFKKHPETEDIFQVNGAAGLNTSISGMVLKPWDERTRTSNQLQPVVQHQLDGVSGAKIAAFQMQSLPGGGSGLPIQFVITTTENFNNLNEVVQIILKQAYASGLFMYIDPDLKIDKAQASVVIDRDKAAELGLTMQDVANVLASAQSENYINYFDYFGRSYQVIPQVVRSYRLNPDQILQNYINVTNTVNTNAANTATTAPTFGTGNAVPISTIATVKTSVVPESINHFQQLNSATISAVALPSVTMGDALAKLKEIADNVLPQGYSIDYGAQSRQYVQEGSALIATFFFALIIIFLSLAALFESFRDPLIVLISVPMSICGAMIFISLGIGGATLNIYSEVGLVTLIGLISKHGILIVQFANDLQVAGKNKMEAVREAASIRLRPILMTTAAMVLGVIPLILATGAGAVSRFNIGLVIATGISIGTLFTLFVVPAMYMILAAEHQQETDEELEEI